MNEDPILSWLQQLSPAWKAIAGGFASALVAAIRGRPIILWYLYGFVCTLVAWPLVVLPVIHALLVRPHAAAPEQVRQRHRRAEAPPPLPESAPRSHPNGVARVRGQAPARGPRRPRPPQPHGPRPG